MSRRHTWTLFTISCLALATIPALVYAVNFGGIGDSNTAGTFDLQVTPSPLVATIKPGVKNTVQLKIRNAGTEPEALKIEPRAFKISSDSTSVSLQSTAPPDIDNWLTLANPTFTVSPGEWYTENITLKVPAAAGFSYSFALDISRQKILGAPSTGQAITGSVDVFTLINVDRPGAKAQLDIDNFQTDRKVYEYLPANLSIRFRNSGNTISQPSGNIFIQHSNNGTHPLAALTVNPRGSYILPGTTRTISATWNDGFPHYDVTTGSNGKTTRKLSWAGANLSRLRIGRYTASLVAVYNENGRDVPITGTVSFWVIPWKIIGVLLLVLLLVLFALFMIGRFIYKLVRRGKRKQPAKKPADPPKDNTTDV